VPFAARLKPPQRARNRHALGTPVKAAATKPMLNMRSGRPPKFTQRPQRHGGHGEMQVRINRESSAGKENDCHCIRNIGVWGFGWSERFNFLKRDSSFTLFARDDLAPSSTSRPVQVSLGGPPESCAQTALLIHPKQAYIYFISGVKRQEILSRSPETLPAPQLGEYANLTTATEP
jgi:hypothetical protein